MADTQGAPDEVVTNAKLQFISLPEAAGKAALITLDNGFDHTKPNTFGVAGLESLNAAIDEASVADDVVALAVTGKPFIFAVGADLTGVVTELVDQVRGRWPDHAKELAELLAVRTGVDESIRTHSVSLLRR